MTVIAWDGKTLAADKRSTSGSQVITVQKTRVINGCLVAGSGSATSVLEHMAWFAAGANPEEFPSHLRSDDLPSIIVVITADRKILSYEEGPYPIEILDKTYCMGSGRSFARAALHLGFDAIAAVQCAIDLDVSCGNGIDTLTFAEGV